MDMKEVKTLVDQLTATICDAADDAHEAALLLLGAKSLLEAKWHAANQDAAEASAQLVIEKRAVVSGIALTDAKDTAARLLRKHPSEVTAVDILNLPLYSKLDQLDQPADAPAPTPKVP
jgi:hypothetical protein